MSDVAGIALRSWDVISAHGPLVGQATRLARGTYDLGPLQYWLLTVPVHLDPLHGVLWGAALWCMLACSLTIEAAWSVVGEFGGVLASVTILGVILWISGSSGILGISGIPGITGLPSWNPWFGMMFFLASLAAAWAVMAGHRGWWPVLMITASVAAQAHLMYAAAAAALVLVAFIVGMVDSFRGHTGFRWAAYGLIAGLACWLAPLIQELTAQTGNLTALFNGELAHRPTVGLSFGLKALTAAVQPPPLWWTTWASLPGLGVVERRSAAFGVAALVLAVVALAVAIYPLRSRRTAALAVISLLVSATALITYSGVPVASITTNPTSLNYLMAPMYLVGVLAWLTTGSVLVLIGRRVISRVRARAAAPAEPSGGPVTEPRKTAARWAVATTGFAVATLIALTSWGIASGKPSSGTAGDPVIHVVNVASQKIERRLPGQAISLSVMVADDHYRRRTTFGLVYALRTAGYRPEVNTGYARQLGPGYQFRWAKVPRVRVYWRGDHISLTVRKHGRP
jgi:hypothetical protein